MTHRTLLVVVFVASTILTTVNSTAESKQEKFWREYISACFPNGSYGRDSRYIDSTNLVGPGSVWGMRGGSLNLTASQSSYLGAAESGKYKLVQYATSTGSCTAKGVKKLGIDIGVPVAVTGGEYAAEISAAIGNSRDITVTIDQVQIDRIGAAEWSDEMITHAKPDTAVFRDAVDGNHYLMTSAYAISKMTITYKIDSTVSAGLMAKIKAGEAVTLGSSDKPLHAKVEVNGANNEITLKFTDKAYVVGTFSKINKLQGVVPIFVPDVQTNRKSTAVPNQAKM